MKLINRTKILYINLKKVYYGFPKKIYSLAFYRP
jgi:hypothetical protein